MAKAVDQIVSEYESEKDPIVKSGMIQKRLFSYSTTLTAWAEQMADIMVRRASDADYDVWKTTGAVLSKEVRNLLKDKNVGGCYERLKQEQVELIKSIPLNASEKVVNWCREGLATGERWETISKKIQTIGDVTKRRADCIARTETARARSEFTQARAEACGSKRYIWHTVGDGSVRPMHKKLDGTIQEWAKPPLSDLPNIHAHAGQVWNCRCFCEPLWEDD